ncbi:MAG: ATP-binding protein [Candidatus Omnitrophica bacterium]|nr:ATP-binding protein [Candidatus Omnitrophota bacterium]
MQNGSAHGNIFFGRGEIRALLAKRLEAFQKGYRQNIGIIGAPSLGKTHILNTLAVDIATPELLIVFFSCREFDSFERFAERWMGKLLYGYQQAFGKPAPLNFQELVRSSKDTLPKTIARMRSLKKMILARRYDPAYRELLSLTAVLHQESGKKILMILDDFDRLSELGLRDPFGELGKEMMVQKETMFVAASSRIAYSQSIFREKLSLLFGNFEVIALEPFDFRECAEFFDAMFPGGGLTPALRHFLIRATDGNPFYLDVLTRRLLSADSKEVDRETFMDALTSELLDERGLLYRHFESRFHELAQGRPWPYFADLLVAVSRGHKKMLEISRFLHQKPSEVKKILEKLTAAEVLEKHGTLFQVKDNLFRFWLRAVYYRKRFLTERSPVARTSSFRGDLEQAIRSSELADGAELPNRLEALFLKFQNDTVELNHRKFKCSHFTEVSSRPNNGRVFPVTAKNSRARWLCQILSSKVQEDDIRRFLDDAKQLRSPIERRLMIGIRGIDLNAKLLAQEAKIQYLDLRSLNFLLDVHDQPKIVLT